MTHPHRSSRTGLISGFKDLANPDHRRLAACARLLTVRLATLRDIPDVERLDDACEYQAHLTVAHLTADAMATAVADTGCVEQVHVEAAGYLADLVRRAHHIAAGALHFGPDTGDLVRLARAAHRSVRCWRRPADRLPPRPWPGPATPGASAELVDRPGPVRTPRPGARLRRARRRSPGRARRHTRRRHRAAAQRSGQRAVRQYAGSLRAGAIRATQATR